VARELRRCSNRHHPTYIVHAANRVEKGLEIARLGSIAQATLTAPRRSGATRREGSPTPMDKDAPARRSGQPHPHMIAPASQVPNTILVNRPIDTQAPGSQVPGPTIGGARGRRQALTNLHEESARTRDPRGAHGSFDDGRGRRSADRSARRQDSSKGWYSCRVET